MPIGYLNNLWECQYQFLFYLDYDLLGAQILCLIDLCISCIRYSLWHTVDACGG
jgi:hypothetical protein